MDDGGFGDRRRRARPAAGGRSGAGSGCGPGRRCSACAQQRARRPRPARADGHRRPRLARRARRRPGATRPATTARAPKLETIEIHGEADRPGRTRRSEPATARHRRDRADARRSEAGRPIRAGYRDLSLIAISAVDRADRPRRRPRRDALDAREVRRPARADGSAAARASAEAAPDRRPGQGARRSGRAGRVRLDADDGAARARSGWAGDADHRRRAARDPSVGLRGLPAGRAGHVDPLPARLDRDGDAAVARRRRGRRRARHAHAARARAGRDAAPRHAARSCATAPSTTPPGSWSSSCPTRRSGCARRPRELLVDGRPTRPQEFGDTGWPIVETAVLGEPTFADSYQSLCATAGAAAPRWVAMSPVDPGSDTNQDLVPDRDAGQPGRPRAGHGRRPRHVLLPGHAAGAVQGRAAREAGHRGRAGRSGHQRGAGRHAASCASRWPCRPISCGCRKYLRYRLALAVLPSLAWARSAFRGPDRPSRPGQLVGGRGGPDPLARARRGTRRPSGRAARPRKRRSPPRAGTAVATATAAARGDARRRPRRRRVGNVDRGRGRGSRRGRRQ